MKTVKTFKDQEGIQWRVRGDEHNGYFIEYRKPGEKNYTPVEHFIFKETAVELMKEGAFDTIPY